MSDLLASDKGFFFSEVKFKLRQQQEHFKLLDVSAEILFYYFRAPPVGARILWEKYNSMLINGVIVPLWES